jgi:hypothetical protein
MGLFDKLADKAMKGITRGVGNAVQNTAERKVTEAVQTQTDRAADKLIKTAAPPSVVGGYDKNGNPAPAGTGAAGMDASVAAQAGGLAGLAGMVSGFAVSAANEAAKNLKICPKCETPASADKRFCPSCGAALPEQTLGAGAVCAKCGKQNSIGERFCADCGAKLPFAEAEEQAARQRDGGVLEKWKQVLPEFPVWPCGGRDYSLEENGPDSNGYPYYHFSANGVSASDLMSYRALLKQNGFRPAGEYPSEDMLYKRVNGVVYCFESAEPFMSDPGCMGVSFGAGEPRGGFDYVKPVKKENKGFFGLFKK